MTDTRDDRCAWRGCDQHGEANSCELHVRVLRLMWRGVPTDRALTWATEHPDAADAWITSADWTRAATGAATEPADQVTRQLEAVALVEAVARRDAARLHELVTGTDTPPLAMVTATAALAVVLLHTLDDDLDHGLDQLRRHALAHAGSSAHEEGHEQ